MKPISVCNNLLRKKQNKTKPQPFKALNFSVDWATRISQLLDYISPGLLYACGVGIVTSILQKNWDDSHRESVKGGA